MNRRSTKHLGIRFRYADEYHPSIEPKACALSVDQLRALPREITDELLKAAELLDSPRILEVIHRIGAMDQDLTKRLRDMVKNLQYKGYSWFWTSSRKGRANERDQCLC